MFFLCSSDFDGSLEESRDDLQSFGYDTPALLIRSDSYTTLLDATEDVRSIAAQSHYRSRTTPLLAKVVTSELRLCHVKPSWVLATAHCAEVVRHEQVR